jgi:ABC-type sugar transport system substrate-binding protein
VPRLANHRDLLRMTSIVSFMAAALLTVATAASAETVGFSQIGAESDWRAAFTADMKAEALR